MIFDKDKFEILLNECVPKLLSFFHISVNSSKWWWNYVGGTPDTNAISVHIAINRGTRLYNLSFDLNQFSNFPQFKECVELHLYRFIRDYIKNGSLE